uniref:NADH-ubiquinone oxidoreductase chain 2 n=1 Tax=Daphnia similis TaxID=35528 RepID=A0A510C1K8_9CRUS|nr:NADH dehydrogenase subunit 2 [Daphnia similis]AYE40147.1 NADH dehydrogenase subunit 2 [Daphnia similis]
MWLSPFLILMLVSIFSSIFLVISSPSLLISWVGLELNTLVFLPIILNKKLNTTSEASIKYFLTQTMASILIILSAFSFFLNLMVLGNLIMMLGLAIKLGAAPFHSWLLSVAENLTWVCLFILLTIQKINPLLILWEFIEYNLGVFDVLIILSLSVGSMMGLIQTSTRLLLTFSSINHLGWLLISLSFDLWLGSMYFLIYMIVLLPLILIFNTFNISYINESIMMNFNSSKQIFMYLSILSLGGLPPFLGFLPKWLILQSTMSGGWYFFSFIMILTSLFTLFYYLRLTFSAFIMGGMNLFSSNNSYSLGDLNLIMFCVSILGLPLFLFI